MRGQENKYSARRYIAYFFGLLFYAFGACLNTKARLGITAITSVSYVFAEIMHVSLGTMTLVYNVIIIALERVFYGNAFEKKRYLQLPLSIVFSAFIDGCMLSVNWIQTEDYVLRVLIFAIAIVIMALGISLTVYGDIMVLPAEGMVQALCYRLHLDFGRAKMAHDCVMVLITVIASFVGLGYLYGVHVGTVVAAFVLGPIARMFLKRWEGMEDKRNKKEAERGIP